MKNIIPYRLSVPSASSEVDAPLVGRSLRGGSAVPRMLLHQLTQLGSFLSQVPSWMSITECFAIIYSLHPHTCTSTANQPSALGRLHHDQPIPQESGTAQLIVSGASACFTHITRRTAQNSLELVEVSFLSELLVSILRALHLSGGGGAFSMRLFLSSGPESWQ